MSEFGLLKRIARHIRYRKLDALIGTQFDVQDWESFDAKLPVIISTVIPPDAIIGIKPLQLGAFLKYGILDIDVQAEAHLLENDYRRGIHLLDEMKWLDRDADLMDDEGESFLMQLWEDIQKKETYLKLFLHAIHERKSSEPPPKIDTTNLNDGAKKALEKLISLGFVTSGFKLPNTFKVLDAYLTNAHSLKMWKNFYW